MGGLGTSFRAGSRFSRSNGIYTIAFELAMAGATPASRPVTAGRDGPGLPDAGRIEQRNPAASCRFLPMLYAFGDGFSMLLRSRLQTPRRPRRRKRSVHPLRYRSCGRLPRPTPCRPPGAVAARAGRRSCRGPAGRASLTAGAAGRLGPLARPVRGRTEREAARNRAGRCPTRAALRLGSMLIGRREKAAS